MISLRQEVVGWLGSSILTRSEFFEGCQLVLYGSVARGAASPRDCDVAFVYPPCCIDQATFLRKFVRSMEGDFFDKFSIPLSSLFLSTGEYREFDYVFGDRMILPSLSKG